MFSTAKRASAVLGMGAAALVVAAAPALAEPEDQGNAIEVEGDVTVSEIVVGDGVEVDALDPEAAAALATTIDQAVEDGQIEAAAADDLLGQARNLLETTPLPDEIKEALGAAITFLDGSGGGGPEIPGEEAPPIAQFLYPTVGTDCIAAGSSAVGTALAVAGPAELPPPGPAAGEAGFVFTMLGTGAAADEQAAPPVVKWVNINTGQTGTLELDNSAGINKEGPATVTGVAQTGYGTIVTSLSGGLTSKSAEGGTVSCSFLPTVGIVNVK